MSRTEYIKSWVEIVAILCGGLWAGYKFIYLEYFKVTRFLTVTVDMERDNTTDKMLIPIRLNIAIENKSSNRLFIESAYFELYGDNIQAKSHSDFTPKEYEAGLNEHNAIAVNSFKILSSHLIGGGCSFHNAWLDSKEKLVANRLIYISQGQYDQIESNVYVLSVSKPNQIDIRQQVNNDYVVNWEVRRSGKENWIPMSEKDGRELINRYAGFSTANNILPLGN